MHAIQIEESEDGPKLVWREIADPEFGEEEALIQIEATAVNRADLAQAEGNYPPPPGASPILGLDMAGTIEAVGENVAGWKSGDQVCALLSGGGYAEKVVVHQDMLMPIPEGWNFAQAASFPEVFLTAFVNIFMEADFRPEERVLIHGGASGVGTAAIQLVKAAGGTVITTAGKEGKVEVCRELGADLAVNYREEDFAEAVRDIYPEGIDIVLDMVGADYLERNIDLLRTRGRIVFIASLSGADAQFHIGKMMGKRARLIGSVLRSRPLAEKVEIVRRFRQQFWPEVQNNTIRPIIGNSFSVQEAQQAHDLMRNFGNIGKIVLNVG